MNILVKQYRKYLADFHKYLGRVSKAKTPENVHQLRVAVKKMRVLLRLMEQVSIGKFSRKGHFSVLRKLFKTAGKVREAHINISEIGCEDVAPGFIQFQEAILAKTESRLDSIISKFNTNRFNTLNERLFLLMNKVEADITLDSSRKYLAMVGGQIYRLSAPRQTQKSFHRLRKKFRVLQEVLKFINLHGDDARLADMENDARKINRSLGDWHDKVGLAAAVKVFAGKVETANKPLYKDLLKHLRDTNKASKNRLVGEVVKFQEKYLSASRA